MSGHDDRRLRGFFRDLHEEMDREIPPYATLIRPARSPRSARLRVALAGAFVTVVVAGALLLVMHGRSARGPDDGAMRLASQLDHWEAPTDFLLQTPGLEYLQSPPRFGMGEGQLPGDPQNVIQKEATR